MGVCKDVGGKGTMSSEIEREGYRDYFTCKGVLANQYEYGAPEYNQFERRWIQAQKANPSLSISAVQKGHDDAEREEAVKRLKQDKVKEA